MSQDKYSEHMDFMSKTDKYNLYIVDNIRQYLGKRILDVGCGIGNLTKFFSDRELTIGIDKTNSYLEKFNLNIRGKAKSFKIDILDDNRIPELLKFNFDTILCSNVIEHIEYDIKAINNMTSLLQQGGRLILIVPAYKFLFGTLDKLDLHYRRYAKKELIDKVTKSGLKIKSIFYYNSIGIIWWFINGKILKRNMPKTSDICLINKTVPFVKFLDKILLNRVGLSLVVVAEKE